MKVGILTFHHSDNFGAVLQAFALQSLLSSWGHDVVVLNHASHRSPAWSRWRDPLGGFTKPVERVRGLIHGGKYRDEFARFRAESLRLTRFLPDPGALSKATRDLDLILTGSDQVWHFSREPRYFLSWSPPFPGRKIAYAASCGSDQQPEGNCDRIGSWIRSFDFVSVRDDFSARLVRQVSGLNPQVVADPALLVNPSPWVKKPSQAPDKYSLIYHLGPSPAGLAAWLHRFPRGDHPHPWVWVNGQGDRIPKPPPAEIKIWHAAPGEWLGWIRGCHALVTDSFHAAIFALHFQKPFVLVTSDRFRSPRLTDLAQRYDLAGHLISRLDLAGPTPLVPPSANTRERVRAHVEQSLGFLRRALASH
jgi:hypothetical protein